MLVLIVEDDKTQNYILEKLLKKNGFEVITSFSGLEALEKLKNEIDIKLIISDIDMEPINGLAFKNLINNDPQYNSVPFIFLTGKGDPDTKNLAFELGANDFILKPLVINTLLQAVFKLVHYNSIRNIK